MRNLKILLLGVLAFALALPATARAQAAATRPASVAFVHVSVIDATGSPAQPDMTVVIAGDRIAAIGKTGQVSVPKDAQVVEAGGKFLIPGLWDFHVHTRYAGIDFLRLFVANGVTGVRDTGGPWEQFDQIKRWRSEIAAGRLVGPRIISAGPLVDGPNSRWTHSTVVKDAEEARKAVYTLKEKGADFIKVYDLLTREEYAAIIDQAKKSSLPFIGHVPFAISASEASDVGQKSIEHLSGIILACSSSEDKFRKELVDDKVSPDGKEILDTYSDAKAAALFAKLAANKTWQTPTLVNTWVRMAANQDDPSIMDRVKYIPKGYTAQWNPHNFRSDDELKEYKRRFDRYFDIVSKMRAAGVEFLSGTDTLKAYNLPGFSLQQELVLMNKAGLSPMEVLQSSTRNPARFLGMEDKLGTVEKGKIADLVLLDANPLDDISNTQKIEAVMVGGRLLPKQSLQEMLAAAEAFARDFKGAPSGR